LNREISLSALSFLSNSTQGIVIFGSALVLKMPSVDNFFLRKTA
jgi:hypothetical protein